MSCRAGQTVTCGNGVLRYEMDTNGIIVYRNGMIGGPHVWYPKQAELLREDWRIG